MRRALSIILGLIFGLGPLAPAFGASEDARLPACCRRQGAHHCAMAEAMVKSQRENVSRTPVFAAPSHCRNYPDGSVRTTSPGYALAPIPHKASARVDLDDVVAALPVAMRFRQASTHAVRGPPDTLI